MVNALQNQTQHYYVKQTYPIYLSMCPQDTECKCNNMMRSKSFLLSLEGNSLNIETEGAVGENKKTQKHQGGKEMSMHCVKS